MTRQTPTQDPGKPRQVLADPNHPFGIPWSYWPEPTHQTVEVLPGMV